MLFTSCVAPPTEEESSPVAFRNPKSMKMMSKLSNAIELVFDIEQQDTSASSYFFNPEGDEDADPSLTDSTRSTSTCSSASSDTSSLSCFETNSDSSKTYRGRHRVLFDHFWGNSKEGKVGDCFEKSPGLKGKLFSSSSSPVTSLVNQVTYDKSLYASQISKKQSNGEPKSPSTPTRRKLFTDNSWEACPPELALPSLSSPSSMISSSKPLRTPPSPFTPPKASCLRKNTKISIPGAEKPRRVRSDLSESSSVSFKDEVDVFIFERPQEHHTNDDDWISYFA